MITKSIFLVLAISLSIAICTVAYGMIKMSVYRVKAAGLPWLLNDPLYWLLMVLIVGGEIWIGINKVARR